jgi:serine protease Do
MSVRTMNWLKFGGLVALAFALGLLFAGLLNLPDRTSAQESVLTRPVSALTTTGTQAPPASAVRVLSEISDAFAAVTEAARPSVVFIKSQRTETRRRLPPGMEQFFPKYHSQPEIERGSGSGFIVSQDGYVLTNNHVVEGAEQVTVRLLDHREFTAKIVGADPNTDVAVLKIDAKGLTPAILGNSDQAKIGEWVLAVGNPLGDNLTFTVTQGIISAKGRPLGGLPRSTGSIQDFIQTDAAINPGNSGGPLVNVRGEVIGINSAIASETGYNVGYGFAIPINLARAVMTQLIDHGKVERAALGIAIRDATANDAAYVGLPEIRGVLVQDTPGDSPAKTAGIEPGDIIVSVDGKPVEYTGQLQQEIGFRHPGDVVKVEVARKGGARKTFSVRLTSLQTEGDLASKSTDEGKGTTPPHGSAMDLLGITVQSLTPDASQELGLDPSIKGVVVTEVQPDGPAAEVLNDGSRGGAPDVILSVEGQPVKSEADLRQALKNAGPGSIVSLRLLTPTGNGALRRIERIRLGGK